SSGASMPQPPSSQTSSPASSNNPRKPTRPSMSYSDSFVRSIADADTHHSVVNERRSRAFDEVLKFDRSSEIARRARGGKDAPAAGEVISLRLRVGEACEKQTAPTRRAVELLLIRCDFEDDYGPRS